MVSIVIYCCPVIFVVYPQGLSHYFSGGLGLLGLLAGGRRVIGSQFKSEVVLVLVLVNSKGLFLLSLGLLRFI